MPLASEDQTTHIVVVGSLNMDLVIQAPRHPRPGETITGGPFRTIPGGKGANQAVAAARMGGQVIMIGQVGADAFGDALIANLSASGVDTGRISRADAATGVALITVSAAGENTIVIAPGANGTVSAETVRANEDAIAGADALLLQLEVPLDAVQAAAEIAYSHGVPIILNPAPARPLPADLLHHVTYLIPNEHEAALLAGLSDPRRASGVSEAAEAWAVQAAGALRASGVGNIGLSGVILTLGERGALVLAKPRSQRACPELHPERSRRTVEGPLVGTSLPEGPVAVPSFRVKVVDTTAAGDAFVGAFAVALTEGKSPVEAARWGCAAGALACTVMGAQPSLPRRAAVEGLVNR